MQRHAYADAAKAFQTAIAEEEQAHGAQAPSLIPLLSQLGDCRVMTGQYPEAQQALERALTLAETSTKSDHPSLLSYLVKLQNLYLSQRQYPLAEKALRRMIGIAENAHTNDLTQQYQLQLISLYQTERKYADGATLAQKLLTTVEAQKGAQDPAILPYLTALGDIYLAQGNTSDALAALARMDQITRTAYGEQNARRLPILGRRLTLLTQQGAFEQTDLLVKTLLALCEANPAAQETIGVFPQIAACYHAQKLYSDEETVVLRGKALAVKAYGVTDPRTLQFVNALVSVYQVTATPAKIDALFQQLVQAAETEKGKEHPALIPVLQAYADYQLQTRNTAVAEPLLLRILAIQTRAKFPTQATQQRLIALYRSQQDYKKAAGILQQQITDIEASQGNNALVLCTPLRQLAELQIAQKQLDAAEASLVRMVTLQEKAPGNDPLMVAMTYNQLGSFYLTQQQPEKAERLFKHGISLIEQAKGAKSTALVPLLQNEARALSALHRETEAQQVQTRAQQLLTSVK
jgi:hypothetical protein